MPLKQNQELCEEETEQVLFNIHDIYNLFEFY